jgi:4-hydroxy-tetrahydrodipicolinate synthase
MFGVFMQFHGSVTALITPFKDGKIDEKAYLNFVQWQIDQGTHGVVASATTGESATLSDQEAARTIQMCREVSNGKIPVMAGCGSNNTEHAVHLTQQAESLGADAALHVPPYFNKPTQEGIYQHFKAIHDATNIPIYLYNVPGRTVVSISNATIARLAELPRIVGVKDATADLTRPAFTRLACGEKFRQLSGEDATIIPYLANGGHGCISVTSNVAPALCAELHNKWEAGDLVGARAINDKLMYLHDAMFCETSPGPVKYAASLLGLCRYEFRLPLVPISKANEKVVEDALHGLNLTSTKTAAA